MTKPRCPFPEKRGWSSSGEAQRQADQLGQHGGEIAVPFKCACKRWHLGDPRKTPPAPKARRRWRRAQRSGR